MPWTGKGGALKIRVALEVDLSAVAGIEAEVYSNPWHPDTFRSLFRQDRARILVAEDEAGGVAGYAVYWWVSRAGGIGQLGYPG